jgi:hypothetical protein
MILRTGSMVGFTFYHPPSSSGSRRTRIDMIATVAVSYSLIMHKVYSVSTSKFKESRHFKFC